MSTGKGTKSIRKSQQGNDLIPSVGFLNTVAKHKATAGQTVIDISTLTVPIEATALGFVQPSGGTLAAIDLSRFSKNVVVSSTARGLMDNPLDYQITGPQQITLRVAALENEIFTITIEARPRVGTTLVAAQPKVQSYTLLAGNTTVPVGPYTVNANPGEDVGDFLVIIDKTVMQRNTDNMAPGLGIEGDYYESTGIITLNTPDLVNDRRVTLVWVGALVDNPQDSQLALVQTLGSQIDAIIPTLAALAGVPESTFQSAPNDVDLAAFGATVITLQAAVTALTNSLALKRDKADGMGLKLGYNHTAGAATALGANDLHFVRCVAPQDGVITRLSAFKSAQAAGILSNMAIYSDVAGLPNTKLGQTGENTTAVIATGSAAGGPTFYDLQAPVTVVKGQVYWISYWQNTTANMENFFNAPTTGFFVFKTIAYTNTQPATVSAPFTTAGANPSLGGW